MIKYHLWDLLAEDQRQKVAVGNAMLSFCLGLIATAVSKGLAFLVENPQNSWMWAQSACAELEGMFGDFLVDYCRFGTPWRKATRLRTTGQLAGQRLRCNCSKPHVILRGRCPPGHGWLSPTPKGFLPCALLLSARMLVSSGTTDAWT